MTMSITVMLGAIGLVVDFGWAYWRKEAAATAANSAAVAAIAAASSAANQSCGSGTTHWNCSSSYSCAANPTNPPASNLDNGCLYAKQNGFLNTGRQTVTIQSGSGAPPTAPGVTPSYYVIATVSESIPTLFSAVLNQNWMKVSSQSTAGLFQGTSGGCVYVLDKTASGAWSQSGGNFLTACGIYIDSSSNSALTMSGGNIDLSGGASVYIAGNKSQSGGVISFSGGGSLKTGQTARGNPISGLVAPTPATPCTPDPGYSGVSNITIPSGTYCSLSISGGLGLVLSGTYIITTGNFSNSGGNVTSAAGGATLYFPPGNTFGTVTVSGGNVTLNASTSGNLQGIAIWKDSATLNNASISGGNFSIGGIIYMPATVLAYSGGNTPVQQTIVVDQIQMSGGNISKPWNSPYFSSGASASGNFIVQ
jgi:hypothetical protein